MTKKISSETVSPHKSIGDNLNYSFDYSYDANYAHRLINAGDRYYQYDANGNIICEQDGSFERNDSAPYHRITQETEDVYSTDYGWGLFRDDSDKRGKNAQRYKRVYSWNEKNQLISSVDANYSTAYIYGQDGQRSNKYTQTSETLYFNKMWTLHTDSGNSIYGGQNAKNIYLGDTRIVTKLAEANETTIHEEIRKQYYYHSDHLGSASLISDYKGDEYQRIEYTPYGEIWVDKTQNTGLEYLPYKFTGKELDEETGLYYYGARYLDPRYSMWISTDPALGEYIPKAPIDEEAKKYNQNLPGMGGVFNHINGNLYAYAANNPVKYTDPDGRTPLSSSEIKYIKEILGDIGKIATENAHIISIKPERAASTPLFYLRQIWLPSDICNNPLSSYEGKNTLIHESFHQVQYLFEPGGCTMVTGPSAFQILISEQGLYSLGGIDVYSYGDYTVTDLSKYKTLSDIPYYEAQAQMVGDFAELYSRAKNGEKLSENQINGLKNSAIILSNSGFKSEAIKWVNENIE